MSPTLYLIIDNRQVIVNLRNVSYNLIGDNMTKEELLTFIYPYVIENDINLPDSKSDMQSIVNDHIEEIIKTYIRFLPQESIRSLREIIADDYDDILFEDSINTYNILRKQHLISTDYDEKNKLIKCRIKKEYRDIFQRYINDNSLQKDNLLFHELINFIKLHLNAYGIIDMITLNSFINKKLRPISENELYKYILIENFLTNSICIYDNLVYSNMFSNDRQLLDFYNSQTGEYYIFTDKELNSLMENTYVLNLNAYDKIKDFFDKKYYEIDNYIYKINAIIKEYLQDRQISKQIAENNLTDYISDYFDVDEIILKKLKELLNNIYLEYPKWIKRGNI